MSVIKKTVGIASLITVILLASGFCAAGAEYSVGSGDDDWWAAYPDQSTGAGGEVNHPSWVLDALKGKVVTGGRLNLAKAVGAGGAPVLLLTFDDGGATAEDFTKNEDWNRDPAWKLAAVRDPSVNVLFSTATYVPAFADLDGDGKKRQIMAIFFEDEQQFLHETGLNAVRFDGRRKFALFVKKAV